MRPPPRRPLKQRLCDGEATFGLIVKMPSAALIETAGHAGFDYVVIDTEHGSGDGLELEHHLRAADSAHIAGLVRVSSCSPTEILHALDAGAEGVVVPRVRTAQAAMDVVRAAHYPPAGERGLATSTRAGRHGMASLSDHIAAARAQTLVVVQIEDAAAVPAVPDICAVDHVDAIFVGPTDLSMSFGRPGELDHPDVLRAIKSIAAAVGDSGCALAVLVGDEQQARQWRGDGAQMMSFAAPALVAARLRGLIGALGPVAASAAASPALTREVAR